MENINAIRDLTMEKIIDGGDKLKRDRKYKR